jgi:uncharacterized Zn finger protein (UPF0148 family)
MEAIERCPACRARLAGAVACPRCGTDYAITRRAERQALALERRAVRVLLGGQTQQALATAQAASGLAGSLLARAVAQMASRRQC